MQIAEHIDVLSRDGGLLADDAERAGLAAPVPTCPGWTIRDLLRHLGGVHRWATSFVATGRSTPYSDDEEQEFFTAPDDPALIDWFRSGHRTLVATLRAADPATTCWAFLRAPSPLAFWARRQAHETAVHLADARSVLGHAPDWEPEFAVDGIDELLNGFYGRPRGRLVADPPVSMALAASDADAAWTVYVEPDRRRVVSGRQPADLTVMGRASRLYLLLWNRVGTEGLDLSGDRTVLDLWRSRATVRWS